MKVIINRDGERREIDNIKSIKLRPHNPDVTKEPNTHLVELTPHKPLPGTPCVILIDAEFLESIENPNDHELDGLYFRSVLKDKEGWFRKHIKSNIQEEFAKWKGYRGYIETKEELELLLNRAIHRFISFDRTFHTTEFKKIKDGHNTQE